MEKHPGMVHMIGTTPLERRHTVRCKLALTLAVCGLLTALGLLPRLWVTARDYGLGAWLALCRFAANTCISLATLGMFYFMASICA